MRTSARIICAILMILLVPAFAQVLFARVLLRCADGRECSLPPALVSPHSACVPKVTCCHRTNGAIQPARPENRCVWTVVPALDLNCSTYRVLILPPEILAIAARDLLAAQHQRQPDACLGDPIEHVPIAHRFEFAPDQGRGARAPPNREVQLTRISID
jgi:hypothetical protein